MQREGVRMIGEKGLSPEIVLQADIGGVQIAFTELVSEKTAEEIDRRLDLYTKAINRQKARVYLTEYLVDLKARENVLREMPDKERAYVKARTEERTRERASWEASHNATNPRLGFQLKATHRQWIDRFDSETAAKRQELFGEDAKRRLAEEIVDCEAKIERQRAIIAGADRSEVIDLPREAAD